MTRLPIIIIGVMRGLDPRVPIQWAMHCLSDRDGRDKPGHDGGTNLCERRLGLADDGLEGRRLGDREVREHLAVDHDAGLGEAGDEAAVIEAERANRRVEALDPQSAERALAPLAVAVGILVRLLHRLLGDADGVLAPAVIAFGGLEDFLVLGVSGDTPFDAGHGRSPSKSITLMGRCAAPDAATGAISRWAANTS